MQLHDLFATVRTRDVTQLRLKFISILSNRAQATDSIKAETAYKKTK
jgi:hypothetical protein